MPNGKLKLVNKTRWTKVAKLKAKQKYYAKKSMGAADAADST